MDVRDVSDALFGFMTDSFGKWRYIEDTTIVPDLGFVRVAESVGGSEGSGEHTHLIFEVTSPDKSVHYYKVDGYYSSYDGTDWDGCLYEVKPVPKWVTLYEPVED